MLSLPSPLSSEITNLIPKSDVDFIRQCAKNEHSKVKPGSDNVFVNCRKMDEYLDFPYKLHMFISSMSQKQEVKVYATPSTPKDLRGGRVKLFSESYLVHVNFDEGNYSVRKVARLKNKVTANPIFNQECLDAIEKEGSILPLFQGKPSICQLLDKTGTYEGRHDKKIAKKSVMYQPHYLIDLVDFLNDCPEEAEYRFWSIAKKLFEGLTFIHKEKITHSDLKPDNIFLNDDFNAIIADFDLSKEASNTWGGGGSTEYLSPERLAQWYFISTAPEGFDDSKFKNDPQFQFTFSADIWAIGCILIYICNKIVPWAGFLRELELSIQLQQVVKKSKDGAPSLANGLNSWLNQQLEALVRIKDTLNSTTANPLEFDDETLIALSAKEIERLNKEVANALKNKIPLAKENKNQLNQLFCQVQESMKGVIESIWQKLDRPLQSKDPRLQFILRLLCREHQKRLTAEQAYQEVMQQNH